MVITPTDSQKKLVDELLTKKVPASEHANWKHHMAQSWEAFNRGMATLRQAGYLPEYAPPAEEGLYRDPETGELYRLKKQNWDLIVSKYSNTAALRLTHSNEVVKRGKWKKFNSWDSRRMLRDTLRASWKMSQEDMVEYRYGICLFCLRGLEDARSVYHNYGPVCASRNGLPWGDLPQGNTPGN